MKCSKCRNYSFSLKRCIQGKIRPPTIKGGVDAARVFGISYICAIDAENLEIRRKIVDKLRGGMEDGR